MHFKTHLGGGRERRALPFFVLLGQVDVDRDAESPQRLVVRDEALDVGGATFFRAVVELVALVHFAPLNQLQFFSRLQMTQ